MNQAVDVQTLVNLIGGTTLEIKECHNSATVGCRVDCYIQRFTMKDVPVLL
jgi:hypothetical protein